MAASDSPSRVGRGLGGGFDVARSEQTEFQYTLLERAWDVERAGAAQ